jgi:hypothetical protein
MKGKFLLAFRKKNGKIGKKPQEIFLFFKKKKGKQSNEHGQKL